MSERVYVFANGSQYLDWTAFNCERCRKSVQVWDTVGDAWPTCEIEAALVGADLADGYVICERVDLAGVTPEVLDTIRKLVEYALYHRSNYDHAPSVRIELKEEEEGG